ncbi:prepilin-type N-terminal cleavage/methylation domain-containing protein [Luminiphilus sp.]|nr:prepilin-type N-terminal cleavage/methylation domain-containing protein [Luminiphilus sp.]
MRSGILALLVRRWRLAWNPEWGLYRFFVGRHPSATNAEIRPTGFSLLELVIVLGIVGILATIALPNYQEHLRTATAKKGALSLLSFALLQERLRVTHGAYQPGPVLLASQPLSAHLQQRYELIVALSPSAFELSLIPKAAQENYPTLTLDSQGGRRPASYWP